MIKKLTISALILVLVFLSYQFIGNLYRGISGVKLIGDKNAYFLGYYMICGVYFVLMLVDIVFIAFILFRKKKKA